MKYFIIFLSAITISFAQTNFKKPSFVWENVYNEGIMSAGFYKFIKPFSNNSILTIGEQIKNTEFTSNIFQCFDITTGEVKWIRQDSIQGVYLNTPNSPEHYYQTSLINNKIFVSTLTKPAGDLPSTFSFRRSFSINENGESQFERLFSDGMQIHRGFHLNRIDDREYCYLSVYPDSTNSGLEDILFHYDNDGSITTIPFNRFSMITMSQWNISNAWRRDENKIDILIADAYHVTKYIKLYTVDTKSKTTTEIVLPSEIFGIVDKEITIERSNKIDNFYYFVIQAKNNDPANQNPDKILVKMDMQGDLINMTKFSYNSKVYSIEEGPNSSVILCGSNYNKSDLPATSSNLWICQYNPDLIKMNEFVWGTDKPDAIYSSAYLNGKGLVIAGHYNKIDNSSGFVSHANIGLIPESVFLDVSSVKENVDKHLTIQIVENSATNLSIVINSSKVQNATIKIIDQNGRFVSLLSQGPISIGEHRFTVCSSLTNGMYLVVCEQNGTTIASEKFIVKK